MREVPHLPVPPGLAARDEAAVRRFLRRARLPLLEGLELTENCWELRVHLARRRGGAAGPPGGSAGNGGDGSGDPDAATRGRDAPDPGAEDLPAGAASLERMLRRRSRAIRVLDAAPGVVLGRACLVPRPRWIALVEEVARREEGLAGLEADVTGPWAPWDFVRLFEDVERETP